MKTALVFLRLFLIAALSSNHASAQGVNTAAPGNQFALQLENATTNKFVFLVVGETLNYRLKTSKRFVAGRITEITDSTISLENKVTGYSTVRHKDLAALKIPKGARRKAIGHILIVVGAWVLVGVTANPAEGPTTFLNYIAYPVGLLAVVKGYAIKHEQKVNLDDSWIWTLKEIKVIDTIERGSFVKIVLKSGIVIEEMKVDKVNSEGITGFEISQDAHEQFVYTSRTVGASDIETLIVKKK